MKIRIGTGPGKSRFALKLGNHRINLCFATGKAIDECDKIINKFNVGFFGLFSTPITFIHERLIPVKTADGSYENVNGMEDRLMIRLTDDVDRESLDFDYSAVEREGLIYVMLRAHCLANIAELREAEK